MCISYRKLCTKSLAENWFVTDDIKHFGHITFDDESIEMLFNPFYEDENDPLKLNFHGIDFIGDRWVNGLFVIS